MAITSKFPSHFSVRQLLSWGADVRRECRSRALAQKFLFIHSIFIHHLCISKFAWPTGWRWSIHLKPNYLWLMVPSHCLMNNYKVLVILPTACVPLSVNESRNRNELDTARANQQTMKEGGIWLKVQNYRWSILLCWKVKTFNLFRKNPRYYNWFCQVLPSREVNLAWRRIGQVCRVPQDN